MDEPHVTVDYGKCPVDGQPSIYFKVTHKGREPIDKVAVKILCDFGDYGDSRGYVIGVATEGFLTEPLAPGASRDFVLQLENLERLRSSLATLSPESHSVVVELNGVQKQTMAGGTLYEAVRFVAGL